MRLPKLAPLVVPVAAAALWAAIAVVTFVKAPTPTHSVYPLFRSGGGAWLASETIYHGVCENFQYWPGFAAFMAPFARLPYAPGAALWSALEFALYGLGALALARALAPTLAPQGGWKRLAAALLLAMAPLAADGFVCQQSNPLLGAALMFGAAAAARGQWWRAALWLLLPGVVKLGPLCFVMLFVTVFPRRFGWRAAALLAAAAALPFLLQSPGYVAGCYREWADMLVNQEAGERWAYRDAWTIWEWCATGAVTSHGKIADMGHYRLVQLMAAGAAFLLCLSWRRGRAAPATTNANGAMGMAGTGAAGEEAPNAAAALLPLIAGAWWLQLFGPSTEIATGALFAPGPAAALIVAIAAWRAQKAGRERDGHDERDGQGGQDGRGKRAAGGGSVSLWLMALAYAFIALGMNGDLEYHLGKWQPGADWPKLLLPIGGVLFGVWLFGWGKRAILAATGEEKE